MAQKRKKEIEFRFYELPKGKPIISLYGDDWLRVYGSEDVHLHFHNLFEIGMCFQGTGDLRYDEDMVLYEPGFVSLIPQNYPHTTNSAPGTLSYWEFIFFSPEDILKNAFPEDRIYVGKLLEQINKKAHYYFERDKEEIARLVKVILEESKKNEPYSDEIIRATLLTLLFHILREIAGQDVLKPQLGFSGLEQIESALDYIDVHYMENVMVGELAECCSLSETHFRRVFGACMNMTPAEYLALIRIKKSCELLNKTNYPMEIVAKKVGYDVVSSYTRNFRKIVGTTPYQYKKNGQNYEGKLLNYKVSAKRGW